jgi:pyruvate dehydrogenase E2 component (dihydrolipoamide acetyltransferase)
MANEFLMPSLGADMEAGTVVAWRVRPGDAVHRGDVVLEVETEKGLIEVEIWEDGVVESILVDVGREVPVGTPLALIRPPEGATRVPTPAAPTPTTSVAPPPPVSLTAPVASAAPAAPSRPSPGAAPAAERQRVSPRARRRAAELGLDLAAVHGSGAQGAITEADVDARAQAQPTAAARATVLTPQQHAAMRRAIGAAMTRAKREIPHYYLDLAIDMRRTQAWLTEQNLHRPVTSRLLAAALLIKAVALAVREVPEMNGFYAGDVFRPGAGIHVGMAISLRGGGLVAPAIHDADAKSVDSVMAAFRDVTQRARAGSLRSSEISDATITVTSLGDSSVDRVFGIIYPPQVALVGFGTIAERPWADHGTVSARPIMVASLAADHRVSDGHRGARFLTAINRLLQIPEQL